LLDTGQVAAANSPVVAGSSVPQHVDSNAQSLQLELPRELHEPVVKFPALERPQRLRAQAALLQGKKMRHKEVLPLEIQWDAVIVLASLARPLKLL
jgi:hypothetical protein